MLRSTIIRIARCVCFFTTVGQTLILKTVWRKDRLSNISDPAPPLTGEKRIMFKWTCREVMMRYIFARVYGPLPAGRGR